MTLTFQGHDLCEIRFWPTSQLLMGKTWPNFLNRVALVRAYKCFDVLMVSAPWGIRGSTRPDKLVLLVTVTMDMAQS